MNFFFTLKIEKLDIKTSRCSYFAPVEIKNPINCQCGLPRSDHHLKAIYNWETYGQNKQIIWKPKISTDEGVNTDAYGLIEFDANVGVWNIIL